MVLGALCVCASPPEVRVSLRAACGVGGDSYAHAWSACAARVGGCLGTGAGVCEEWWVFEITYLARFSGAQRTQVMCEVRRDAVVVGCLYASAQSLPHTTTSLQSSKYEFSTPPQRFATRTHQLKPNSTHASNAGPRPQQKMHLFAHAEHHGTPEQLRALLKESGHLDSESAQQCERHARGELTGATCCCGARLCVRG